MTILVLLDSDLTNTTFCNPDYVTNIQNSSKQLELRSNRGTLLTEKICDIPGLGTHWFDPQAVTNIISLADISKKYRVTLDTMKEKAMIVHLKDKLVKFNELPEGLYGREPNITANDINIRNQKNYYTEENNNNKETYLSKNKLVKAKNAKQLMLALGSPSSENLKKIIKMSFIKDNPITCEDVNLANELYGPKGRTTMKNTKIQQHEKIDIPPEFMERNRYIETSAEIMHINGLMFVVSISHDLFYRASQFKTNKPYSTQ